jgi:hypothetical protein
LSTANLLGIVQERTLDPRRAALCHNAAMDDPGVGLAAACAAAAVIELSTRVRLPLGLVLAFVALAWDVGTGAVVASGAAGATAGRMSLLLRGPGRGAWVPGRPATAASARRLGRTAFLAAMLPGRAARTTLPMLRRLGAPLRPMVAGSLLGLAPALLVTTSLFSLASTLVAGDDAHPAAPLAVFGVTLLVVRLAGEVDWQRARTEGGWGLRDLPTDRPPFVRIIDGMLPREQQPGVRATARRDHPFVDAGLVEGVVVEEIVEYEETRDQPGSSDRAPGDGPGDGSLPAPGA